MTAPADSRISDERLTEILDIEGPDKATLTVGEALAALTELRERRAQAVVPVAWQYHRLQADLVNMNGVWSDWVPVTADEAEHIRKTGLDYDGITAEVRPLYAAPPPAQAAGVTESEVDRAAEAYRLEQQVLCGFVHSPWASASNEEKQQYRRPMRAALASLSAQDREE